MATSELEVSRRIAVPQQSANQRDAVGDVSADAVAREIAEAHKKGLRRRRYRDLTAEKYMIHIDGEGDAQWADLYRGERIVIPPNLSGTPRHQHNLLRPLVTNAVAYHTTMPFRFTVPAALNRAARDHALVDQALVNHLAGEQRWNALFAEALLLAMPYGSCPVHAYWRDDVSEDLYHPADYGQGQEGVIPLMAPQPGMIDCWVGDPWDTVYPPGATANNVPWYTYGRTLPTDLVQQAFAHVPAAQGLEGNNRLPSASRFQRTIRKWMYTGSLDLHGSAGIYAGESDQDLIALVCREIAPGYDPEFPDGRLDVVALQGAATTDETDAARSGAVDGVLLHSGPLPGNSFSSVRVYSDSRFDDVHGKPWVADLDDLQVQLNQLETLEAEYIRRSVRAPLVTPMETDRDTLVYEDNAELEIDPGAQHLPFYLELPSRHLANVQLKIERVKETMFRIGGWQAASRGEGSPGDSGKLVIALARADDTVHGPVNARFRESVERFAGVTWRLMKAYGDVPIVVDALGEEAGYLAEPYIDRTRLSEKPPRFRLVSGFGATPEAKAEQLTGLVQALGADGEPLMTTRQFRAAWPDASTYPEEDDPQVLRERRPKAINEAIRKLVQQVRTQAPQLDGLPMGHPLTQQVAAHLNLQLDLAFPVLMDDDVLAFIEGHAMLTQDETEHPLVRAVAAVRQGMYYRWLALQRQQQVEQQAAQAAVPGGGGGRGGNLQPGPDPASAAGTATSNALDRTSDREPATGAA